MRKNYEMVPTQHRIGSESEVLTSSALSFGYFILNIHNILPTRHYVV